VSTSFKRQLAMIFMLIGGISWIAFGLSHILFPYVLNWKETLSSVSPANVFGITISNLAFIHLFNADLLLYDIMLGVISIIFALSIKKGKRMAKGWLRIIA